RAHRVCLVAHGIQGRDDLHRCAAALRRDLRHALRRLGRSAAHRQSVGRRNPSMAAGATMMKRTLVVIGLFMVDWSSPVARASGQPAPAAEVSARSRCATLNGLKIPAPAIALPTNGAT